MSRGRALIVFALGFFALAAQTLLFRDFLTAFEGTELAVGGFFGAWFLWIAAGAYGAKRRPQLAAWFPPLTLLYVPGFLLEHYLIRSARGLAGVASYELFPYGKLLVLSLLTNAPVSLATGALFTLACRWWEQETKNGLSACGDAQAGMLPVARIYVLETLGAACGGVAVTIMLALGLTAQTVSLAAILVLGLGVAAAWQSTGYRFLAAGAALVLLLLGAGGGWAGRDARAAWARLLPEEAYRGRFATAQAEYLYGEREDQFIVMAWGGVCESLPGAEHGAEVAALALAQRPQARRVLALGPGSLPICLQLLRVPGIATVTWLHPDPAYPRELLEAMPEALRVEGLFNKEAMGRLEIPAMDPRRWLAEAPEPYDLIILNLPDATTLVLNRYFTQEFFALVRDRLSADGVAALRLSGAANYLGGELAYLGASAVATFGAVFEETALKPGDESWLLGAKGGGLTESPAALRDQFEAIPGAAAVYPPEGIVSLYLPDRIAFQREKYQRVIEETDTAVFLNRDHRPKALLYTLLVMLRRAGVKGLAEHLPVLLAVGAWCIGLGILLYAGLRGAYLMRQQNAEGGGDPFHVFDIGVLVAATGLAGMALSIVLMFRFQAGFGSLFLYIGLISALFMFGSFLGSVCCERLLSRRSREPRWFLSALVFGHLALLALVMSTAPQAGRGYYAVLFILAGCFTGVYFPFAAHRMRLAGRSVVASGAALEMLDHAGAATGAVATGVLLLPLFGSTATLGLLALLIAAALPAFYISQRVPTVEGGPRFRGGWPAGLDAFDRAMRPLGYTLFGIGVFAVVASNLMAAAARGGVAERLETAARTMAGEVPEGEKLESHFAEALQLPYFSCGEAAFFSTEHLAAGVIGYGGPVVLAIGLQRDGVLKDFQVLESNETPVYLELLSSWMNGLKGRRILDAAPFAGVDAVSGATLTSRAILDTLERSTHAFAAQVWDMQDLGASPAPTSRAIDTDFFLLAAFLAAAVLVRYRPGKWRRRLFLVASVLLLGLWRNVQYSTPHVFSLLTLNAPQGWLSSVFVLIVLVPVITVLVGNVYCGYVCPFGALQELLGDLRPAALATDPDKHLWRYGRFVKYVLLLLVVVFFAMTRDPAVLSADPLVTVFSVARGREALVLGGGALLLAIPFRRFWCRNLCPAGAFLSLLNRIRLLRRLGPRPQPGRCDLGVRNAHEMDCIQCDRCRHAKN